MRASAAASAYEALKVEFDSEFQARRQAATEIAAARAAGDVIAQAGATDAFNLHDREMRSLRTRAAALVRQATGDASYSDVNYVFPTWITTALPIGIVGLWIAAIITAATDSIAAELNSLSTASVIDFYKRLGRREAADDHYVLVSKVTTGFWGVFAGIAAVYASSLGSLIEVVNRFGSFFYGSILGVFMLAILTRFATGTGAFVGLLAGMASVAAVAYWRPDISFLWHNVLGALVVFVIGLAVSALTRGARDAPPARNRNLRIDPGGAVVLSFDHDDADRADSAGVRDHPVSSGRAPYARRPGGARGPEPLSISSGRLRAWSVFRRGPTSRRAGWATSSRP